MSTLVNPLTSKAGLLALVLVVAAGLALVGGTATAR